MPRGRPVEALVLDDAEKTQLLRLANARSLPNGLVRRAQIVLACARGEPNASIAKRMNLTPATVGATVGKWRKLQRLAPLISGTAHWNDRDNCCGGSPRRAGRRSGNSAICDSSQRM